MATEERLGICVVGAGDMGRQHARAWTRSEAGRVVAIADPDGERASALAAEVGAKPLADYREAILDPAVQAVSVCTPTGFHAEVAVFAAEHGRHVLSEKPISIALEGADAMIAAARRNNVRLAVGHLRRFQPTVLKLKELIADGALGRPLLFRGIYSAELRPKRLMHDRHCNGGPVIDFGVHLHDLWRFLFESEPVRVKGSGLVLQNDAPELAHIAERAIDTAHYTVEFASGDIGAMDVSWGLPPGVRLPGGGEQVLGPQGAVALGNPLRLFTRDGETALELPKDDAHAEQVRRFAECVRTGREPENTGENGRRALEIALAAVRSIETGASVEM